VENAQSRENATNTAKQQKHNANLGAAKLKNAEPTKTKRHPKQLKPKPNRNQPHQKASHQS